MVRSIAKMEARNRLRNANAFGELLYETSIEKDDGGLVKRTGVK